MSELKPVRWQTTLKPIKVFRRKGVHHVHDPNFLRITYKCPSGHVTFEAEARNCWCGWEATD